MKDQGPQPIGPAIDFVLDMARLRSGEEGASPMKTFWLTPGKTTIRIGPDIAVRVVSLKGAAQVRIGIAAPRSVQVARPEAKAGPKGEKA